jgi:hypothetical protein
LNIRALRVRYVGCEKVSIRGLYAKLHRLAKHALAMKNHFTTDRIFSLIL